MSKTKLDTLKVEERTGKGKGPNRRMRVAGKVPGIYYDQKGANLMVQMDRVPLEKAVQRFGSSHVFSLEITRTDGKTETWPSLLWRMKYDPVKSLPVHVDFFGVDLDKEIRVSVPFESTGRPLGEKEGGVLQWFRDSIEVSCKPMDIPESIVLDVSELNINDNISIDQVQFPEGVTPLYDESDEAFSVVGVAAPAAEEVLEAAELEGEEGAEGEEGGGEGGEGEAEEGGEGE